LVSNCKGKPLQKHMSVFQGVGENPHHNMLTMNVLVPQYQPKNRVEKSPTDNPQKHTF